MVGTTVEPDEDTPDWLIFQLGLAEDANRRFGWYRNAGYPTILFRNTFMDDYLVAGYSSEAEHERAGREAPASSYVDGYVGIERLYECFKHHSLMDSANLEMFVVDDHSMGGD